MKYYLNIKSGNLKHYIETGIILPASFYENRFNDIQSKVGDAMLLTKKTVYINNSDMIIELDVEDEKVEKLDENFYILKYPIPLSRIMNIVTKSLISDIKIEIEVSGVGFIENLYMDKEEREKINCNAIIKFNQYDDVIKFKTQKFNAFLGGYALLKLNYKLDFNKFDKNLLDLFFNDITKEKVIELAQKENIQPIIKLGKFLYTEIQDKNSNTYLLMILFNYFHKKPIKTFINDFLNNNIDKNLSDEFKTKLLFYYGFLVGYKTLKNKYFDKEIKFYYYKEKYIFDKVYNMCFEEEITRKNIFEESDKFIEEISNIREFSLDTILKLPKKFKIILKNLKNHYFKLLKKNEELEQEINKLKDENGLLKQSEDNFILMDLNDLNITQLKEIAKQKGISSISKYSNKNKDKLVEIIKNDKGLL